MLNSVKRIHFVGIGGIGMSGLARILVSQGKSISGSDLKSNALTAELSRMGAKITHQHEPDNITDQTECVVVSTAISEDNPEYQEALRRQIPILHRSEVLRHLLANSRGISVTGTHGKTTTSGLMSVILNDQDLDPTIVIGGEVPQLKTNARAGQGEFTVAEVDESDQSLRKLSSEFAIISNLEVDHLDHYKDLNEIIEAVLEFIHNQPENGRIFINADDPGIAQLMSCLPAERAQRSVSFALKNEQADYRAVNIELHEDHSSFEVLHQQQSLGRFKIGIPGEHNVYNALSTLACGHSLNFEMETLRHSLQRYEGVKRRFQFIGELAQNRTIIDDYAHHPSEIEATLKTASLQERPITAIFQPHRYSRTEALLEDFSAAFELAQRVIFLDVYAASENPADFEVKIQTLVERTLAHTPGKDVSYQANFDEVCRYLKQKPLPDEMIITLGAGNITELSRKIVAELSQEESSAYVSATS